MPNRAEHNTRAGLQLFSHRAVLNIMFNMKRRNMGQKAKLRGNPRKYLPCISRKPNFGK